MILSVFFIALAVIYAAKVKNPKQDVSATPSAGRVPAAVVSDLQLSFEKGSADLSAQAMEEMGLLLPALKAVKSGFIEVEGYADGTPVRKDSNFSSNLDLSNRRAVRVAEWLIKNGVPSRRIRTFSYGDGFQWSNEQVPTNRRVLIKVAAAKGVTHD